MKNTVGLLKISICAAFLALFAAPFFFSSDVNTSASEASDSEASESNRENPQNCRACHQENYDSWHRSSHAKSVRQASAATVKGDFAAENHLKSADVNASMTSDGANFTVEIGDENYRVAWVVGAKYLEQYVAEKDGEFYVLPVAYDLKGKRWTSLEATVFQKKDADFARHLKKWKTDCAACHRSGEKVQGTDSADGFDDFGISCAACHGDASEHVQAKNSLWAKLGFGTENAIVNPQNLSSDASMMVCAQCHSREAVQPPKFEAINGDKIADAPLSAHQNAAENAEKLWANGASKFSGNEYQSLLRSVCYAQSKSGGHGIAGEKINCASCHSTHETTDNIVSDRKSFDQSCLSCHSQFSDENSIAEHTKHSINSEASICVSCHQPETVYGRLRFYATHEISVPNPSLTVEKGIPNACNLCHADESVNWAIAASKKLWSERFRAAEISPDKQFDQPEGIRALTSGDDFLRALTADAIRKHPNAGRFDLFLPEIYRTEKSALVKYFINAATNED